MPGKPNRSTWWVLLAFVAACFAAAAMGGAFTASSVGGWYQSLKRPSWTPPDWLFSPVWTALYLSMAVAGWLAWRRGGRRARPALVGFAVQLVLNVGWSVLFFGLREPGPALAEIVVLWMAILYVTVAFWRLSRPAGLLMLPYLAWVGFAAVLNLAIWRMNASS